MELCKPAMLAPEQPAPASTSSPAAGEIVIQPARGWIGVDWAELVRYRELLSFLVWRDVKVKYKQAVLGIAWAIILPIISLAIYGGVAKAFDFRDALVGFPKPPILLWMFAGLVPWMFLQRAISDGGMSLLNNQPLMTKIYLPRLFLPLAALGNAMVDMLINVGLLSIIAAVFYFRGDWQPTWQIIFLVPLFVLLWVAAMGLSFFLSAATVLYRDLRFLIPFFVQFGLWLSAVPYPLAKFEGPVKLLYALNPAHRHHQRLPQRRHRAAVGVGSPGLVDRAVQRDADLRVVLLQARGAAVRGHRMMVVSVCTEDTEDTEDTEKTNTHERRDGMWCDDSESAIPLPSVSVSSVFSVTSVVDQS
jgi:lipopolysaccharide transport system permease protein